MSNDAGFDANANAGSDTLGGAEPPTVYAKRGGLMLIARKSGQDTMGKGTHKRNGRNSRADRLAQHVQELCSRGSSCNVGKKTLFRNAVKVKHTHEGTIKVCDLWYYNWKSNGRWEKYFYLEKAQLPAAVLRCEKLTMSWPDNDLPVVVFEDEAATPPGGGGTAASSQNGAELEMAGSSGDGGLAGVTEGSLRALLAQEPPAQVPRLQPFLLPQEPPATAPAPQFQQLPPSQEQPVPAPQMQQLPLPQEPPAPVPQFEQSPPSQEPPAAVLQLQQPPTPVLLFQQPPLEQQPPAPELQQQQSSLEQQPPATAPHHKTAAEQAAPRSADVKLVKKELTGLLEFVQATPEEDELLQRLVWQAMAFGGAKWLKLVGFCSWIGRQRRALLATPAWQQALRGFCMQLMEDLQRESNEETEKAAALHNQFAEGVARLAADGVLAQEQELQILGTLHRGRICTEKLRQLQECIQRLVEAQQSGCKTALSKAKWQLLDVFWT